MTAVMFHVDTDGYASAALVQMNEPDCRCIPVNYGWPLDWDKLRPNEKVYVVDFTYPVEDMKRLNDEYDLVWIDHHDLAIDPVIKELGTDIPGIQAPGMSGVALTWTYFYPNKPLPYTLKLIDAFDTGRFTLYPEVLAYQKAINDMDVFPIGLGKLNLWKRIFNDNELYNKMLEHGNILLDIERKEYSSKCRYMCEVIDIMGKRALIANFPMTVSTIFDSVVDADKHDIIVGYYRYFRIDNKGKTLSYWKFGVRAACNKSIDVGKLCNDIVSGIDGATGGGHEGAGGFTVKRLSDLPFMKHVV